MFQYIKRNILRGCASQNNDFGFLADQLLSESLSLLHTTLAGCSRRHHQAWLGCVVQTGAIKISSLGPFFVEISRSWILRSGQESVIQLMMCAESVPYILSPDTSLVSSTAGNEPSRNLKLHNHGEGS